MVRKGSFVRPHFFLFYSAVKVCRKSSKSVASFMPVLVWSENGRIAPGSIGLGTAPIGKIFKRNYNRNTPPLARPAFQSFSTFNTTCNTSFGGRLLVNLALY